ncbi:MAG: hypothetical protein WCT19_01570 [Candidatus Paceibacterota bacterium]|jgi:hypothetical protein
MGFFGDSRPKVSQLEFDKVRSELSTKGFDHKKLERLEVIFDGVLGGINDREIGLDTAEVSRVLNALRSHPEAELFTENEINQIEAELKEKF